MSIMYVGYTGIDDIYNTLLGGTVNHIDDFAMSVLEFSPDTWLDLLLDSGNGFGAVVCKCAFAREC